MALIGDISKSTTDHTSLMNTVEGFFRVGSIVVPAVVAILIRDGLPWKCLYVVAAAICALLIATALTVRYPRAKHTDVGLINLRQTFGLMKNVFALGFSLMIALYVSVEVAIYVWMPTYLQGYHGPRLWLATYALTIFFILRAGGRFIWRLGIALHRLDSPAGYVWIRDLSVLWLPKLSRAAYIARSN